MLNELTNYFNFQSTVRRYKPEQTSNRGLTLDLVAPENEAKQSPL